MSRFSGDFVRFVRRNAPRCGWDRIAGGNVRKVGNGTGTVSRVSVMPIGTVAVLVNPRAGSGRASTVGRRVVEVLRARGMQVRELVGSSADESESYARQAVSCGVDALVAVGGDGIVHLALQAVAQTPVVLGVMPCGSGNDFARSLGLPLRSPAAAVGTILAGHSTVVDLGRAGGR